MSPKLKLWALFILLQWVSTAWAEIPPNSVLLAQKNLEDHIIRLVQIYEPNATAFVSLEPETKKTVLPFSPFLINRSTIDAVGNVRIKKAQVTIFNQAGELSPDLQDSIRAMTRELGVVPEIKVEKMPNLPPSKVEKELSPAPPKPLEEIQKVEPFLKRDRVEIEIGLAAVFILIFIAFTFALFLTGNKLARTLENTGNLVKSGWETRPAAPVETKLNRQIPALATVPPLPVSPYLELNEQGVLAILSDCYWAQENRYASFLWRRIPVVQKRWVLEKMPHLGWFAASLTEVASEDLGLEQAPYYLNPLPIFHLDNVALLQLVKKYPLLFAKLPELRKRALPLRVSERIKIFEASLTSKQWPQNLENIPASIPRKVEAMEVIPVHSVEEEEEILSLGSLSLDWKKQIPSLAWLLELPTQEIENQFKNYSAFELSEAWVGPKKVLETLSQRMAPKKLQLLTSYLNEQVTASRSSETFKKLHQFSVDYLSQKNIRKGQDEVAIKKAA